MQKKWRLGLDLGTNSLGWAVLTLDSNNEPCGLEAAGVRIFSDGRNQKDYSSNAATRRVFRGARKNRDRYLQRRKKLMNQLKFFGLMPADAASCKALEGGKGVPQRDADPWILRYRGLDEKLDLYQFGRALFHLNQRRGFKSNRKADREDSEKGKVKDAIARTKKRLGAENARTLGELFGRKRFETIKFNEKAAKGEGKPQPRARVSSSGEGAKLQYDYYPTRELISDEFCQLWEKQSTFYPDILTDCARDALQDTIVLQRSLKEQKKGKCTFEYKEDRADKAMPTAQQYRIYEEANHLRIQKMGAKSRDLTKSERDKIADLLCKPSNKKAERTFKALHKSLSLKADESFNLESESRKSLVGDETAATLMQEDVWGKSWLELSLEDQDRIVSQLLNEEDEEKLINWLCKTYDFEREKAERIANCSLKVGVVRLSLKAMGKILPFLKEEVIPYSEAAEKAGYHHSQLATGEVFPELPYYGKALEHRTAFGTGNPNDFDEKRYGKVANPTVHTAMNQVRATVNDLIKRFGKPEQIVVEVARDLPLSKKGKSEHNKEQAKNREANEERAKDLENTYDQVNNYGNRQRLRLYEELTPLDKRCVFTGKHISATMLFSSEVEIEHILPYARTLDDSFSNKVLCLRQANRDKGNRTPFEAFSDSKGGYNWNEILERAKKLPKNKQWRFDEDAMEHLKDEENFLARHLNDTRYAGKLSKEYLETLFGGQGYAGSNQKVWVVTGRLTSEIRHIWGLNSVLLGDNLSKEERKEMQKDRSDHRHHAIDAIVVGCTSRSLVKEVSEIAKAEDKRDDSKNLLEDISKPWQFFREDVKDIVRNIVVSHKRDHGHQASILEDTTYGLIKGEEPDKKGKRQVVVRKPLKSLEPKDLFDIRDKDLLAKLYQATEGLKGKEFKKALQEAGESLTPPVYNVRVLLKNQTVVAIKDSNGNPYKAYKRGSNYCLDIWEKDNGKWDGEIISTYDAYQLARSHKPKFAGDEWWRTPIGRNGKKLIMRIRKNDCLEIDFEGRRAIVKVYKMFGKLVYYAEKF